MKKSTLKLIIMFLLTSTVLKANTTTKQVFCMESGQKTPLISAEYSIEATQSKVVIKEINGDGTMLSENTYQGAEPELSIREIKYKDGEDSVVIQTIDISDEGPELRVLVCTEF